MFRKLIAPIALRFKETDALIAAMEMLERGLQNPYGEAHIAELERAMLVIARELIRRKVVFWA